MRYPIVIVAAAALLGACGTSSPQADYSKPALASLEQDFALCSMLSSNIVANMTDANAANATLASASPGVAAPQPMRIPSEVTLTNECMWGRGHRIGEPPGSSRAAAVTGNYPSQSYMMR